MRYFLFLVIFSGTCLAQQFDFITKFEKSGFMETARYEESMNYVKELEKNSPFAKLITFGLSPQKRDIVCLILSKEKAFTPEEIKKTGKPVILIINGIHSGEIEGKDASFMLLREILVTKEKENYLDSAIIMVVPIFSVDGHERFRKFNRINQNGPVEMGWRTSAMNLNLNRDWLKADAPEMQAMLKLIAAYSPDFFVDTHTTDGADFQYTLNYGVERYRNIHPSLSSYITNKFLPFIEKEVNNNGYLIAPYLIFVDGEVEKGLIEWAGSPRISQGYMAARNRIGLLVETHMLKPYKERVFSTKVILEGVIKFVSENKSELLKLNSNADKKTLAELTAGEYFPLAFKNNKEHDTFNFKGIKSVKEKSEISGAEKTVFTGEKYEIQIPYFNHVDVTDSIKAPKGYLIPAQFEDIINRIKLHGVNVSILEQDKEFTVTKYKFKNVKFSSNPYESHFTVNCDYDSYQEKVLVLKGTYYIETAQNTIKIILHLLEPESPESFLRWGFFNQIFEQKEYFEDYVMEKVALEMLKNDPVLKKEFEEKLAQDEKFRSDPYARLNFFYKKSPYFDEQFMVYPILRVE